MRFDENLMREFVANALNSPDKGYFQNVTVSSTKTKFGKGVPDEILIPSVRRSGGIIIAKDIKLQRTRMQYGLCEKYKLGVFFLKPSKGLGRHWENVKMLINNWEEIISAL